MFSADDACWRSHPSVGRLRLRSGDKATAGDGLLGIQVLLAPSSSSVRGEFWGSAVPAQLMSRHPWLCADAAQCRPEVSQVWSFGLPLPSDRDHTHDEAELVLIFIQAEPRLAPQAPAGCPQCFSPHSFSPALKPFTVTNTNPGSL